MTPSIVWISPFLLMSIVIMKIGALDENLYTVGRFVMNNQSSDVTTQSYFLAHRQMVTRARLVMF